MAGPSMDKGQFNNPQMIYGMHGQGVIPGPGPTRALSNDKSGGNEGQGAPTSPKSPKSPSKKNQAFSQLYDKFLQEEIINRESIARDMGKE